MVDFNIILSQLEKVSKPNADGNYMALCPFHDDTTPSLSLNPVKGAKCFSETCEAYNGVSFNTIAERLGINGNDKSKVKSRSVKRKIQNHPKIIEATYDYEDENGEFLFQVVRYKPKSFSQRRKSARGDWIWNLQGIRPVLFRLPKIRAIPHGELIFVVEGEKDVIRLEQEGLVATTSPMGAGKWGGKYSDTLREHNVVLIPDNDTMGLNHMERVAQSLEGKASNVKTIILPNLPYHGDVSDWLDAGKTVGDLINLIQVEHSEKPTLEVVSSEDDTLLQFPEDVWYGLFSDYRNLMGPTTESSDNYHFAVFASILGATLGRRISVFHARLTYPNFYTCLVGRSGVSRKDTSWSRGMEVVDRLHSDVDPENPAFQIIPGIGSAEGLVDALTGERKVVILNESEFRSLLTKAKQEGSSNLIPKLTSLYDCPLSDSIRTRSKTTLAKEPFLTIASGTTLAWLKSSLSANDIHGGFANRFIFVTGVPKSPLPYPPETDKAELDALLNNVNKVRQWAEDMRKSNSNGKIHILPETTKLFADYYSDYHKRCNREGVGATMITRIQGVIWKLALLYAAIDLSEAILPDHLERALLAGGTLERSMLQIFGEFEIDDLEARIIGYLTEKHPEHVSRRDLLRKLSLKKSEDFVRTTRFMEALDIIRVHQESNTGGGRPSIYYYLPYA